MCPFQQRDNLLGRGSWLELCLRCSSWDWGVQPPFSPASSWKPFQQHTDSCGTRKAGLTASLQTSQSLGTLTRLFPPSPVIQHHFTDGCSVRNVFLRVPAALSRGFAAASSLFFLFNFLMFSGHKSFLEAIGYLIICITGQVFLHTELWYLSWMLLCKHACFEGKYRNGFGSNWKKNPQWYLVWSTSDYIGGVFKDYADFPAFWAGFFGNCSVKGSLESVPWEKRERQDCLSFFARRFLLRREKHLRASLQKGPPAHCHWGRKHAAVEWSQLDPMALITVDLFKWWSNPRSIRKCIWNLN